MLTSVCKRLGRAGVVSLYFGFTRIAWEIFADTNNPSYTQNIPYTLLKAMRKGTLLFAFGSLEDRFLEQGGGDTPSLPHLPQSEEERFSISSSSPPSSHTPHKW